MSDMFIVYAVYYEAAADGHDAGYVWNNILVPSDGAVPTITGSLLVSDPDRKYPIGSTYKATS